METAVIYARYSTSNQRDASIEDQVKACKAYADHLGVPVLEVYADRAISGRTDHRPEFQRMIKDSAKNRFQLVILYTLDRFARDRYDHAHYKRILKRNGVRVAYAEQRIPDSPEGIILESMLEGYSEYYSQELSRKVTRGLIHNAENCMSVGGTVPLGYKLVDRRYVLHEVNADIVKQIFSCYADGKSVQEIIRWLNEKSIKTARGNSFNKNSLTKMLKNRKYLGIFMYRDIEKPGGIPRIISDDLFERVQRRLEVVKHAKAHNKGRADYLLTTKAFCGHCGAPLVGESGTSKTGATHYYYKCAARKREKTCNKHIEHKDALEMLVVRETVQHVLSPENIQLIAQRAVDILNKEAADHSLLHDYERQLKETETAISNILRAIEAGIFTASTRDRLEELEKQKADLHLQISLEKVAKPTIDKDRIVFWLEGFVGGDVNDVEYRRRVIDTLLNRVDVYDTDDDGGRRLVLTYNLTSDNTSVVECSDIASSPPPQQEYPNTFLFIFPSKGTFGISIMASID